MTRYYAECSACGLEWPLSNSWAIAKLRMALLAVKYRGAKCHKGPSEMLFRKKAL